MVKKKREVILQDRRYGKGKHKFSSVESLKKLLTRRVVPLNTILLEEAADGSKIFIHATIKPTGTGFNLYSPPYFLGVTFPITKTQEEKINWLRKADNFVKSLPSKLAVKSKKYVFAPDGSKLPEKFSMELYGNDKRPWGELTHRKEDYKKLKEWVKKRYKELLKDKSLKKYYARYSQIAEELVGKRFGNLVIKKELSIERIKTMIYCKDC